MEAFGGVGLLMNLNDKNAGGEILKSLLTSSKMQKTESVEVNILSDLGSNSQNEKPIVFQIELGQSVKSEFLPNNENIFQHFPVTYLTGNNQNLSPANNETIVEPITYVLSRDIIPDTSRYCTVGTDEPQKIILVQEVDPNDPQMVYNNSEAVKESQINECLWKVNRKPESRTLLESKGEGDLKVNTLNKKMKKKNPENSVGYQAKSEKQFPGKKAKVEKKISTSKKPLNKRKNSKLKSMLKTGGKGLVKKQNKGFDGGEVEEDELKRKKNLFELTRLEDNVDQVAERLKIGCDCSESNCFDGLNPQDVFKHRLNIADLTKAEHDMFLMGVIMASFHNLEETTRHKERIRIRSYYAYKGKKVCLTAFLYLQHVTLYQMKSLRNHLKKHGVSPKVHGNRGRKPANTFSLEIYRRAANFVQNYIEEHCVKSAPSFTPFSSNKIGNNSITGTHEHKSNIRKENKLKIANKATLYHLPPEHTKRIVHGEYKTFCESLKPSLKVMKYSTFTSFLKKQFPNVKFHKKEEKKPEKIIVKFEEKEKWKTKEGKTKTEKREDLGKKCKEELGIDKSIQVDKSLGYIPTETEVLINDQRLELHDDSEATQPAFGVVSQVLVSGQLFKDHQTHNSECQYAIDSTV